MCSVFGLNWDVIWRHREEFLSGLALGLKLAVIGLAIACVIGLLVAFARTSRHRWLSRLAAAYVEFIRNIPLLLILFFLYFGLPMWAYSAVPRDVADLLVMDGDNTTIVALAIYGGAYLAEVFRAGILSVSRSFVEAGRSLGLSGRADRPLRHIADHVSDRPPFAQQHVHLPLQGHLAGHGHRRTGTDVRHPQSGH